MIWYIHTLPFTEHAVLVFTLVQEPKLEDDDDDDDDDEDKNDEDADGGEWKCDDDTSDGPGPTKSRRQTFDGPVLPLDADSTFALPGRANYITSITLHFTLQTIYSGISKSNFKDHYGDAATQQRLGMIAEINEFSVSDEML